MKLDNDQHERFCQEYIIDLNGTKAAIRAKFSEKTARSKASQLLTKVNIQDRIAELKAQRAKRMEIIQDRVLEELAILGYSNIKDYIKSSTDGLIVFKDMDTITEEQARAIEAIKVNVKEGKIEFKLHSKTKTLEMICRHLGMFVDKFDVGDNLKKILYEVSEKFMPKVDNEKK